MSAKIIVPLSPVRDDGCTTSDIRYFDRLTRGPIRWTGTGTSVRPLLGPDGEVVVWRAYDGVFESYCGTEPGAVAVSRRRYGVE